MTGSADGYVPGLRPGRRALISDVDGTLLDGGSPGAGTRSLGEALRRADAALVLSSGRDLALSLEAADVLQRGGLPRASGLVCGVGTEVYLWTDGRYLPEDDWSRRLASTGFDAEAVRGALADVSGLTSQPHDAQSRFKVSYYADAEIAGQPTLATVAATLEAAGLAANLVYSAGLFLDVLPTAASKGSALLYLAERFSLAGGQVVAAGDSGNDRELLVTAARAGMVAVLVANHEPEMEDLRGVPGVLAATGRHAFGVLEGIAAAGWPGAATSGGRDD